MSMIVMVRGQVFVQQSLKEQEEAKQPPVQMKRWGNGKETLHFKTSDEQKHPDQRKTRLRRKNWALEK